MRRTGIILAAALSLALLHNWMGLDVTFRPPSGLHEGSDAYEADSGVRNRAARILVQTAGGLDALIDFARHSASFDPALARDLVQPALTAHPNSVIVKRLALELSRRRLIDPSTAQTEWLISFSALADAVQEGFGEHPGSRVSSGQGSSPKQVVTNSFLR